MKMGGRTLSVREAAGVLGLGLHATYRAVREQRLPVLRSGRKVRVPMAVLEQVLKHPERFSPVNETETDKEA